MTFLVEWADRTGRLPSEALALYERHPRDFKLLMAMKTYQAEKEQREMEAERKKAGKAMGSKTSLRS